MFKKRKFFFITLMVLLVLIIIALLYLISNQDSKDNNLSSPGFDFPPISKNKPVHKINNEMQNYFGKYAFLNLEGNNIIFSNTPHSVKYKSSFNLSGDFALNISISSGKAIINIGDIEYIITPNESTIKQGNKTIFSENELEVNSISIETGYNFDNSMGSVARLGGNGVDVDMNFPADISIEVIENSSGVIGRWKWLRGSM